jgi:uncharacterized membrane protein YgaE (UPF0421/DUF939 family)
MDIASELEKLKKLQNDGVLTDAEFVVAKKKLLETVGADNTVGAGAHLLGKAANNYVNFQITTTKVGFVIAILFFFFFFLPQWNKISDRHDKLSQQNDAFREKVDKDMEDFDKDFKKRSEDFDQHFKKQSQEMEQFKKRNGLN